MSSIKERLDAIEERLDNQKQGPVYENPDSFRHQTIEERLGRIESIAAGLGNDLSQAESDISTALYVQQKCKHCPKVGRLVY